MSEIEKLHPALKGIGGTAPKIISFDEASTAYNSYGKDGMQGYNAPISKYATFAYGTALNYLLASEKNRIRIGDTTVAFWAESSKPIYNELAWCCFNPPEPAKSEQTDLLRQDNATEDIMFSYLKAVSEGKPSDLPKEIDQQVNFYIIGITLANKGRASIRFFAKNSYGDFINNITNHYENMKLQKSFDNERDFIPIWMLLSETVSPKAKEKTATPLLAGAVMRAILTDSKYPEILYSSMILRVKAERDVSYVKASIIKACLLRKNKKYEEVLKVALNEEYEEKAYILGRLFAYLEKAQEEANGSSTVKARFFTSACSTPKSVFPTLLKLSGHHIAKAEYSVNLDKQIGNLLDRLKVEDNPFPAHLDLEKQGVFILGYYQQRRSFFTPKADK